MNELQIGLIGLGVLLVALVWGYNLWQARKQRRMAEAALPKAQPDVLMAGRQEVAASGKPAEAARDRLREPTFGQPAPAEAAAAVPSQEGMPLPESRQSTPVPAEWADARADCLLRIEFIDAVPVANLWTEQADWSPKLDKPLQWLGLDERSGRWRTLLPQDPGAVAQVAVALQLVDRRGPVSEATLSAFLEGVRKLAQRFAGLVEIPELAPVLAAARALDGFCAALDLQLALHVLPRQGSLNEIDGSKLKPLIEAAGLQLQGERYLVLDANGAEIFALGCHDVAGNAVVTVETQALVDLVFSLDVPRVTAGAAAFDRMIDFARRCAEAVGGQLADAHKKPLSEATIAALRSRIDELQAQMARQGIPAGEVRALRLFS
jgi:hypothetical protein